MSAVERLRTALEACSPKRAGEPPDYATFKEWFHQTADREHALRKGGLTDPDAPHQLRYVFDAAHDEMLRLGRGIPRALGALSAPDKLDEATARAVHRDLTHWKLLYSGLEYLTGHTERGRGVFRTLHEREPPTWLDAPGEELDGCDGVDLRRRLFVALNRGLERDAFKILGRLREEDHDEAEREYLEALTSFRSQDLDRAISYASRVPATAPDYPRALVIAAKSHALQGDVEHLADVMQGARTLQVSPYLLLTLRLIVVANADRPEHAARSFDETAEGAEIAVPQGTLDPDYHTFAVTWTRLVIELGERLDRIQRHLPLLEEPGEDNTPRGGLPSLEELCGQDPRLDQLLVTLQPFLEDERLPAPPWDLHGIARTVIGVLEPVTTTSSLANELGFECLLRFGLHDDLVANFERDHSALFQRNDPAAARIVSLAYPVLQQQGSPLAEQALEHLRARAGSADVQRTMESARVQAITSSLSSMGRAAYEAAVMALHNVRSEGETWCDAGMVSLGFFRILELEINQRLLIPSFSVLDPEELQRAFDELSRGHRKRWMPLHKICIAVIRSERCGLELGPLQILVAKLSRVGSRLDAPYRRILREALEAHLTATGTKALESGELAGLIDEEARNRYRNPPAHTRFLPPRVALECRSYVDDALVKLGAWFTGSP